MSWLERLKKTQNAPRPEPKEPKKAPSLGFLGTEGGAYREKIHDEQPASGDTQRDEQAIQGQPDDDVIVRTARITYPNGERRIHFFGCKPSSLSEVRQWYPGSKIELLACGIPEKEKVL